MKKTIYFSIACIALCWVMFACNSKKEATDARLLSFDPKDSVLVDELMRFYIDSNIIPKEFIKCPESGSKYYTFACINDSLCEISNNYMQDSLSGTFYVEVVPFETGSSGNNNIYICQKNNSGYHILLATEGQIDSEIGPDTMINNYNTLYIQKDEQYFQLYFDGKQFAMKLFKPTAIPVMEETDLLTNN